MSALEIIIEELIYEKQKLEKQKEKNLQKIKYCEERIAFYIKLYQSQTSQVNILKKQITSYQNIIDFSETCPHDLLNLFPPSSSFLEEKTQDLTRKKRLTENSRKVSKQCIGHYTSEKEMLEEENQEIDERLSQIEIRLNLKPKIKKRGIK